MNYQIIIKRIDTVNEGYWSDEDFIQLLGKFNFPDAETAEKKNLPELLEMVSIMNQMKLLKLFLLTNWVKN
jgi:hypothetical protein